MFIKDAKKMKNGVNSDQTVSSEAVWPVLILFAQAYLSEYLETLKCK